MPKPPQDNPATVPRDAPPMWQFALLAFLLVAVFAGPSYMLASSESLNPAGLWIPIIGMFLLLLALAGLPELRRKIGTRIMRCAIIYILIVRTMSLCFILGFGVDILLGVITLRLTRIICGRGGLPILNALDDFATTNVSNGPDFLPTFIATCIQGALLFVAFLFVLLLALPVARHHINMKTAITSACLSCGYDLRMTPERCPECGTNSTDAQRKFISNLQDASTTP